MPYFGRVILTGLTPSGDSFVAYSISGRSPPSKKRKFEVFPDEGRVYVGPVGQLTEEQEKMRHLIFYNCMRTENDTLFTTNGLQTDVQSRDGFWIKSFLSHYRHDSPESAGEIMDEWKYENDSPIFTPRTALVKRPDKKALFAIAAKNSDASDQNVSSHRTVRIDRYSAKFLATYKGHDTNALPWRGSDLSGRFIKDQPFDNLGDTPDEIRDEIYNWMDQRYVVSAVAAVWDGHKWAFSEPRNLFNTEEDFQRITGTK